MSSSKKIKIKNTPNSQKRTVVNYDVDSYKKENFRWSINTQYLCCPETCGYDCKRKCSSFYNDKEHLFDIFKKLDEYRSWSWSKIESSDNGTSCGYMDIEKLDVKDMIKHHFASLKLDYSHLYKIEIKGRHRVWGIRQNDELFIIWNDKDHSFYKHVNKNYS